MKRSRFAGAVSGTANVPAPVTVSVPQSKPKAVVPEKPKKVESSSKPSTTAKPAAKREKQAAAASKPTATKKKPQPVIKYGWVVQLGTFANKNNVERIRTRLSSKGFKVRTETVRLASGPATRVQVGPYGRKAQAETMRKRIESDLGLKGSVLATR